MDITTEYAVGLRAQPDEAGLRPLDLLWTMALSREGDRREDILHRQGKGYFQLPGAGHEALAVLAYCLDDEDNLYPHYRDRALMLARGLTNYEMALAFFAKDASSSAGRQMSSHFSSRRHHVFSVATPTGIQCLPAAGAAWACQKEGKGRVTVCCIGDAAIRQGDFYEALSFAFERWLPLIFVVEDNGYGISTPTAKMDPWNLGVLSEQIRVKLDGRDPHRVHDACRTAVRRARMDAGPTVLWMEMDRLFSHTSSDDQRVYRSPEELASMSRRDPLELLRDELIWGGQLTLAEWKDQQSLIEQRVIEDYERAEGAAAPDPARVTADVFAPGPAPARTANLPSQGASTMVSAVNETLRQALEEDPGVLVFGQDIEDPKGGVFGLTKGLSSLFPHRVTNSPLAESTIAGVAVGLAVSGYKPVFELQFIDFAGPAFNQIVNQIATLRWRTAGEWTCPLVLLAPCGAYLPAGGPWHSQTNEAWFAHAPGLRIAMPSTPHDAAALLRAAIAGHDPTLLLLPKHLFRRRVPMEADEPISLGKAAVRREGTDATVVAWGNCVEIALTAAERLSADHLSAEVIDLRSIVPCDWGAIRKSIAKTGRLVIVQEDNRTCSFGQAIIAEMTSRPDCWDLLSAPPQLVSRMDVHVGFHPLLEEGVLPTADQVCRSVRLTMDYES